MKKNILIVLIFFSFGFSMAYCQTKRKTRKENNLTQVKNNPVGMAKISFASYASGIDHDTYEKLRQYLLKNNLKYSEKPMGREGEVDVQVDYSERSAEEKKKISDFLKSLHNPEKLVRVEIQ
jgi:hypothetical protein